MKRLVLILVLMLLVDLADDGCIGKSTACLPQPLEKTSVTSCQDLPVSGQVDVRHELASPGLSGSRQRGDARPASLLIPPTLQIMHRCHFSSSGGIPL